MRKTVAVVISIRVRLRELYACIVSRKIQNSYSNKLNKVYLNDTTCQATDFGHVLVNGCKLHLPAMQVKS